jgi:hypothetical protein
VGCHGGNGGGAVPPGYGPQDGPVFFQLAGAGLRVTHDDPVNKRPQRVFSSVDEVTGEAGQDRIATASSQLAVEGERKGDELVQTTWLRGLALCLRLVNEPFQTLDVGGPDPHRTQLNDGWFNDLTSVQQLTRRRVNRGSDQVG